MVSIGVGVPGCGYTHVVVICEPPVLVYPVSLVFELVSIYLAALVFELPMLVIFPCYLVLGHLMSVFALVVFNVVVIGFIRGWVGVIVCGLDVIGPVAIVLIAVVTITGVLI